MKCESCGIVIIQWLTDHEAGCPRRKTTWDGSAWVPDAWVSIEADNISWERSLSGGCQ